MKPNVFSFFDSFGFSVNGQINSFIKLISGGFTHEHNLSMKAEKFHSHKCYEAHFIIEGEIDYCIEGREVNLPANHFLIFPPKVKHEIIRYTPGVIKLSMKFEIDDLMYKNAVSKSDSIYEFNQDISDSIKFIIKQVLKKNVFKIVIINRMLEIVYFALEYIMDIYMNNLEDDAMDGRLMQAKEYILYNRHRFLNCSDVALYCQISKKQLNRIFKKYEGMTTSDFIQKQKIYDIKKYIRDSMLPFNEIAKRVGFNSASYFVKFFKKNTGMTPNEYRKKYRENNDFDIINL